MIGPLACLSSAALWSLALTLFHPVVMRHGAVPVNVAKGAVALVIFGIAYLASTGIALPPGMSEMGAYEWWTLIASAFLGMAIADSLQFVAIRHIGPQRCLLVFLLGPVVTSLFAWALLGETQDWPQIAGILLTIVGIGIVVLKRTERAEAKRATLLGLSAAFLAVLTNSIGIVWNKPAVAILHALPVSIFRIAVSIVVLWAYSATHQSALHVWQPLLQKSRRGRMLVASTIGTGCAFYLYNLGIEHSSAGVASALTSTTPLWAIPIVWVLEKERPTARTWIGTIIAVLGVCLITVWQA